MRGRSLCELKKVSVFLSKLFRFLFIPAVNEKVCPFRVYFTWLLLIAAIIYVHKRTNSGQIYTSHPQELLDSFECPERQSKGYCCPRLVSFAFPDNPRGYVPSFLSILKSNSHVCDGGWQPPGCQPIQKVAIIIPYRDRELHLRLLLPRLHSLLFKQQVAYRIFVVEQAGNISFNRGLLMNIGVMESLKLDPTINCFIFHDVDLLPENSLNLYACDKHALRHLSSAIDDFRFHSPFGNYAGGVSAMSESDIMSINGFPTRYWGWGSEDDEFSARAIVHNLPIIRPPVHIGRYKAPRHIKAKISADHQSDFMQFENYLNDGFERLKQEGYTLLNPAPITYRIQGWGRLPAPIHKCAHDKLASSLGISPKYLVVTNRSGPMIPLNVLERVARDVLFTHILVDPTELYKTTPNLQAIGNRPVKSLYWFLHFYGWI